MSDKPDMRRLSFALARWWPDSFVWVLRSVQRGTCVTTQANLSKSALKVTPNSAKQQWYRNCWTRITHPSYCSLLSTMPSHAQASRNFQDPCGKDSARSLPPQASEAERIQLFEKYSQFESPAGNPDFGQNGTLVGHNTSLPQNTA